MKIILVGNPNVGKSTLFNTITNSNAHTGNWHGVTIEELEKDFFIDKQKYTLVDLPGLYSLSPNSFEEKVAVEYILNNHNCPILCLCSNVNLKHNLLLLTELLELGRKVILVINNMTNETNISIPKLENLLNIKVLLCNAKNKNDVGKLLKLIQKNEFKKAQINISQNNEINIIKKQIKNKNYYSQNTLDFFCQKALNQNEFYINKLKNDNKNLSIDIKNDEFLENNIQKKYQFIDELLRKSNFKQTRIVGKSKIDKIILNRYFCIPIFVGIIAFIFYITFFSVGRWLSDCLGWLLQDVIGKSVSSFLANHISIDWIVDMIDVAIFGGVATVVSFLPQVVLLFLFLDVLEQSGYISRLAFMLDDMLKKVGLSGKSVYTLLMGFGCSTTACLTARNMSDKNAKIKTAMLAPFMSCSAKLPVYAVIGGAFFGAGNVFIIVLLYLLGIIIALLLSLFFEKTYLKSKEQSFLMEFPDYQKIDIKKLAKTGFLSVKNFIVRIGTTLVALSVIIWILENFSFSFQYIKNTNQKSIFQCIGEFLSPIFKPLGFSSWGITCAIIAGLVAKEIIVSSIAIFNHVNPTSENFMENVSNSLTVSSSVIFLSPSSALSFMVFCLLYCPCIATISVLKKEIGKKWTIFCVIMQFLLAYITSMLVYTLFRLTEVYGTLCVGIVVFVLFIVLSFLVNSLKNKKCSQCSVCNLGCKNCK